MTEAVLDASALLAVLANEPGYEAVVPLLADARISTVNLAEVLSKLVDADIPLAAARDYVGRLGVVVDAFDESGAALVAHLRPATRSAGLSLGDRACLALARQRDSPAVTADRSWAQLDIDVTVEVVR